MQSWSRFNKYWQNPSEWRHLFTQIKCKKMQIIFQKNIYLHANHINCARYVGTWIFYVNKPENPFQTVTSQKFVDILLIYCSYIAHMLLIFCSYVANILHIYCFYWFWADSVRPDSVPTGQSKTIQSQNNSVRDDSVPGQLSPRHFSPRTNQSEMIQSRDNSVQDDSVQSDQSSPHSGQLSYKYYK